MTQSSIIPYPSGDPIAHLSSLIARARQSIRENPDAAADCLRQALELLARPARDDVTPSSGALAPWQRQRIIRHVDANLAETLDVEGLAAVARLSVRQFSRAFKASFGVTPAVYVQRARLSRVQERLLSQSEPLSVTAAACGFKDETQLCRVFRHALGYSPKAWRRWRAA
jgi:AraC family transcriptional regulator